MNNNDFNIDNYPKSSIGTHVMSPETEVQLDEKYTGLSWFFLYFFGTSQNPVQLKFTCLKSGETFFETTDKTAIKKIILYRPK